MCSTVTFNCVLSSSMHHFKGAQFSYHVDFHFDFTKVLANDSCHIGKHPLIYAKIKLWLSYFSCLNIYKQNKAKQLFCLYIPLFSITKQLLLSNKISSSSTTSNSLYLKLYAMCSFVATEHNPLTIDRSCYWSCCSIYEAPALLKRSSFAMYNFRKQSSVEPYEIQRIQ